MLCDVAQVELIQLHETEQKNHSSLELFLTFFPSFLLWFLLFQILKIEQHKEDCLVHMYLFIGTDSQELDQSINYQLGQSEFWNRLVARNNGDTITGNRSLKRG